MLIATGDMARNFPGASVLSLHNAGNCLLPFRAVSVIASQKVSTQHIGLIHLLINLLDSAQQDCEEKHLIYSIEWQAYYFMTMVYML